MDSPVQHFVYNRVVMRKQKQMRSKEVIVKLLRLILLYPKPYLYRTIQHPCPPILGKRHLQLHSTPLVLYIMYYHNIINNQWHLYSLQAIQCIIIPTSSTHIQLASLRIYLPLFIRRLLQTLRYVPLVYQCHHTLHSICQTRTIKCLFLKWLPMVQCST